MPNAFQPIENYGVIGNMRSIALVSVRVSSVSCCKIAVPEEHQRAGHRS